jgi:hypothetical protein
MVFDDIWKAHLLALPHHPLAARSASEVVNFDHADFAKGWFPLRLIRATNAEL